MCQKRAAKPAKTGPAKAAPAGRAATGKRAKGTKKPVKATSQTCKPQPAGHRPVSKQVRRHRP